VESCKLRYFNSFEFFDHSAAEAHGEGVQYELINRVNKLSCARDGGRPLGIGFQEQVSNHLQAAVVKSHGGERWRKSARTNSCR
jgi:hypothetical protein